MADQPVHPVPTQRRVFVTALDKQMLKVPVAELLVARGFDPALPWREETDPRLPDGTLYVQDIPQEGG